MELFSLKKVENGAAAEAECSETRRRQRATTGVSERRWDASSERAKQ
jgi:hypothetical protein